MPEEQSDSVSLEELGAQFDLLAHDVKEYAVFLMNSAGRVLGWNPGAEQLFGYRSDEIIGQNFSRFFTPEDVDEQYPERELKLASDSGRSDNIHWQVRQDGTRFWCQSIVTPLYDEQKQAKSFACLMHDLTENEATQIQRSRADGLADANRNKEEFMALLSHELRSPLSPIVNALNILRQMRTNDPIIESAGNIIARQVGQLVRLVDDLLDISRISTGKLRLTKERVELRVVANHAAETARPLMNARKHEFSISLATDSVWVDADPDRLEQVVVNLLNNAAKYTLTGGLIRMTVSREGEEAIIRVTDNGTGIAREHMSQIFDLFTQVDGTLGRSYGGLGIGLALARNLIQMQDGRLEGKSDGLGKGCEFTVALPAVKETIVVGAKTVLLPGQRSGRPLRVLIVEDNIDSGDSLSMLLQLYGHEVQVARTGPTALEMAAYCQPDAILLDIGLPGMDGYQVAMKLRHMPQFRDVMICALTGYTPSVADRQRHQGSGFNHYFVKPVSLERLNELFEKVGASLA